MSWVEFDEEIKSLSKRKYQFSDYQVVENENVRYVIFTPTNRLNTKVLSSISNGHQLCFILQFKSGKTSMLTTEDLYTITMSLTQFVNMPL